MYIVFWFFPSGLANTANNVQEERTTCFLIIEVVVSKHLSLTLSLSLTSVIILDNEVVMARLILIDIMVLNFTPDSIKFLHLHLRLLWSD
jgi:hypothetical protein